MSDVVSPVPKRRRVSFSGRNVNANSIPIGSDIEVDPLVDALSSSTIDLPRKAAADPALLHFLDGDYIRRHTIDAWNTSGGYCDVFTGDHPKFGKVALKRPRITQDGCTASQLRSFASEGHIWRGLHHPNILRFVGMILSDSRVWLVSVFADNGSLSDFIRENADVNRHSLVYQFTAGLAYLHHKAVVHGDLKASNLLISAHCELLIGDFGLSKLVGKGTRTPPSKQGSGSIHWMAPELLFEDDPTKTFASDVYAYAITISEILGGKLPFEECVNVAALIKAISENKRPPTIPQESPQGVSYGILWGVAEDCWAPEPSKRLSMADVCMRFSMDYTRAIDGSIANDATPSEETTQAPGMVGRATNRSEKRVLLPQDDYSDPAPISRTALPNNVADEHLLQLLGDVDYGDIGHMLDDGLCLDGTRVEILERLDTWADDHSSPKVLLVKGQAGRGKSTIARSVSSRCQERWGENGSTAIFHFRRNNEAVNDKLLRALAHQLSRSKDQRVGSAILRSIQHWHGDGARLRLERQFEVLLVQSLQALEPNPPRILLVIDALDECSDHSLVSALLRLIRKHATSLPSTVKFLLTSRPEEHIVSPFNTSFSGEQEDLDVVDLGLIDRDVRAYFTTRLFEIQREFGLDASWVFPGAIDELVSLSQGLFQWAHAAVEYVREQPRSRLRRLVGSPTTVLGLPALYQQILSTAFPLRKDVNGEDGLPGLIQHVIGSLVVAQQPMSPSILEYLWDHHTDRAYWLDPLIEIQESILGRLSSILMLPTSPEGPIHFMHSSIRDFFTNPAQCTDTRFMIDPAAHHARLADICFRRMRRDLKNDICEIDDPSKMNSEVLDIVERRISAGLRYCCRSWSSHLSDAKNVGAVDCNMLRMHLDEFCMRQILHWLEVLSLVGVLSEVFSMLRRATEWVESEKAIPTPASTHTTALLDDTNELCLQFFKPMATNAQQITLSYLFHFPNEATLRIVYGTSIGHHVPRIIRGPTLHRSHWSRVIPTGHGCLSVAFSRDGETIASGLDNGTIQMWNINTREPKGEPLVGHMGSVHSVTFSGDGKMLASGSDDETVRIWTLTTGQQMREPLVGHTRSVCSIAFSPDCKMLASVSDDETVRLWSVATGHQIGEPLVGHTDSVWSVAFSPDGEIVASGSGDETIRLWSATTGHQIGEPLVGHMHSVWSVAFSPDGKILASGQADRTVRLWIVATGQQMGEPLVGHTGWVNSITFSPDGKILASGSDDETIRLWTVATGQQMGEPLVGHTFSVWSVAFSPDGKMLASGSGDGTVRLWSVAAGQRMGQPLVGHTTGSVRSVAFSPEDNILTSESYQETLKWHLSHGEPVISREHTQDDSLISDVSVSMSDSGSRDGSEQGWVFVRGKRCFWLPEEYYLDKERDPVEISLFGSILVLHHPNIHILDISAFL